MPLGSWPLLRWFGEEYYYGSVSRTACTLHQPIVVGTDTPSQNFSGLRLHNVCMGANIVRVRRCSHFGNQRRILARYLVSRVSMCSPLTLRRGIQISKCLPRLKNHQALEKRSYQYNKLSRSKSLSTLSILSSSNKLKLQIYLRAFLDNHSPSTISYHQV